MSIKKFSDFNKVNESSIDDDVLNKIQNTKAYIVLKSDFADAVRLFSEDLEKVADQIGYDEGDSDHNMAFDAAIQSAADENYGW